MTTATNTVARVAAGIAGAALVLSSFASVVGAQTTTTTTTSTTTSATFTRNLTIGSHGTDVTALQTWLMAKGFTIAAGATGYFGAQTKAALAAYQAANAISPAAGYFGPITRAAVSAGGTVSTGTLPSGCTSTAGFSPTTGVSCSTGTTTTTTTGPLAGGEGSLNNFKIVGATNTSLNAADSDTVYGFEFRATGSDLQVNRVDYDMFLSTAGTANVSSPRPWNVFSTAQLMRNNTVVATLDGSDINNWSQDGTAGNGNQIYRLRFDGLKDVVKMDTTADYYLKLSTQNTINSSNNNNIYSIFLSSQGVRAIDAKGINEYSSSSAGSTATVSVSTNTSGSLTVSTGSDNPQATTVQASTNNTTSDVTLATFTLQAKDGDVSIYTIPVSVATTTASSSDLIRTVKLYQGSTLLDTESYAVGSASTSVKFKNLNVKIPQGTTQSFSVKADINAVGTGNTVPEGASVALSIPSNGWDAVNTAGNNVTISGSVTGNVITFRSIGLALDASPSSATANVTTVNTTTGSQQGTFTFTYNVTAFGQDVFFSKNANTAINGQILSNGTAATTTATTSAITSTADTSGSNNYVVHSGQTKQVTVTITLTQGFNQSVYAQLFNMKFGSTDAAPAASTAVFNNNYITAPVYVRA